MKNVYVIIMESINCSQCYDCNDIISIHDTIYSAEAALKGILGRYAFSNDSKSSFRIDKIELVKGE